MKICLVTHRFSPHTGGIETHVRQVSERLVERGHEVVVLTADRSEELPSVEHRNGVEVRRYRSFAPGDAFHIAPGIAAAGRQAEADIVHAHNYHSLPVLFAALGVTDVRFVVTPHYHGGSASSIRDSLLSLYGPVGSWALRQADTVVAVSEWERRRLEVDFGIEARVIPNGIERERFAEVDSEKRDRPYLLTVGRLEEYKGVQYIIRALTALPDRELVVAGSGPYRSELEEIAKAEEVADRVTFLGHVDKERLPLLYAGAEVFLSVSDFEAYGMTVGEGLAAGTPCVVHTAGALSDWTTKFGCVGIDDRSAHRVAEAVLSARGRSPDGASLSTWEEVTDALLDVYDR